MKNSKEVYLQIKAATRSLIKNCGGAEWASSVTRVNKTVLSDYQNVKRPDFYMPADVVTDLEAECGDPIVTKLLCSLAGGYYVPLPTQVGDEVLPAHLAQIGKEVADVFSAVSVALADGQLSAEEKDRILSEIEEAINALASAKGFIKGETQ